jgi:hypothetical protein
VLDIAADRLKWRNATKGVGVGYRTQNYFDVECELAIRDLKATAYAFNLVGLIEAINTGAVTVGTKRAPKRLQFVVPNTSHAHERLEALLH